MKKSCTPDPLDPLKVRRFMALWISLYAFLVWPNILIAYHLNFKLSESLIADLLVYVGTLAAGPIGAYLWAAQKKQQETKDAPENSWISRGMETLRDNRFDDSPPFSRDL